MSQFLSTALLNASFLESGSKIINFPLFTAKEIVDVLEMSNWVIHQWLETHVLPNLQELNLHCILNILPIASFFQFDLLTAALGSFIEKHINADCVVQAYRVAEVTDATLAKRLWRRILTEFPLLYENRAYLLLSPDEMYNCFMDHALDIKKTQDIEILQKDKRVSFLFP